MVSANILNMSKNAKVPPVPDLGDGKTHTWGEVIHKKVVRSEWKATPSPSMFYTTRTTVGAVDAPGQPTDGALSASLIRNDHGQG